MFDIASNAETGARVTVEDSTEEVAFEAALSPLQLQKLLVAKLPNPGRVKDVSLFCSPDAPQRALCLVDVANISANVAANSLGGEAFAFSSVALAVPLNQCFTCNVRQNGHLPTGNCACFVSTGSPYPLSDSLT